MNNEHEPTKSLWLQNKKDCKGITNKLFFHDVATFISEIKKGLCSGDKGVELDLWF